MNKLLQPYQIRKPTGEALATCAIAQDEYDWLRTDPVVHGRVLELGPGVSTQAILDNPQVTDLSCVEFSLYWLRQAKRRYPDVRVERRPPRPGKRAGFDFIWLDTPNVPRTKIFWRALPLLGPQGVLAMHDALQPKHFPVIAAAMSDPTLKVTVLDSSFGILLCCKNSKE